MTESSPPAPTGYRAPGRPGVSAIEVQQAADALLRAGERPTVERIRARLGRGSPNTINPLLDAWWKTIGQRLDAGPAALHRLPERSAHVLEALWLQLLADGRAVAAAEQSGAQQALDATRENLEVRGHVLTLREGELQDRLRDRERTLAHLEEQVRGLSTLLRKEQASRGAAEVRLAALETQSQAPPPRRRVRPAASALKRPTRRRARATKTATARHRKPKTGSRRRKRRSP